MNFDNHLFRVSSLTHILAGLTTKEKPYQDALAKQLDLSDKYDKYSSDLDAIKNKETKTWATKNEQVNKYRNLFLDQCKIVEQLKLVREDIEISEGCKTHLTDIYNAKKTGRTTKDLKNKYVEKGLMVEGSIITGYNVLRGRIFEKNTERKDDGYIMGEIDWCDEEYIYDAKGSWDIWTWGRNITWLKKPRSCPYYPNMQGYMKLWEKPKSKVIYALLDTPEKLIEQEKNKFRWGFIGDEKMFEEALAELEKNLIYSDIPMNERYMEIPIERDEEYIKMIPKVVGACRQYLNELHEDFKSAQVKSLLYE